MTINEIKEGLKSAISRGETMKQAVNSFINAGYNPEEVERASRELKSTNSIFTPRNSNSALNSSQKILPRNSPIGNKPIQVQKISKYDSSDRTGKKILIIGLISILIVLLAGLGFVFFFKDQVSNFLTNLFS
jgi:hypothetical protein